MPKLSSPLDSLLKSAHKRNYAKGQIIVFNGDRQTNMYILKKGSIKMYDIDEAGNEKIVHILRPDTIFPYSTYLGRPTEAIWFFAALSDSTVYVLPLDLINTKAWQDPRLNYYLMNRLVGEMHELFIRVASLNKTTARYKLIGALKFLSVHHSSSASGKWRKIDFPVSHQLLADMTGITRESATLAMQQLHDEGIVKSPHQGELDINFAELVKAT